MSEQKEIFHYTYSAAQQKEIEKIRNKYVEETPEKEVNKMEQLRRLDKSVTQKATTVSLSVGIFAALIMGFGMSMVMTDMASTLGIENSLILGIFIGIIGMLGVISAYPLYQYILQKERKKMAPQILKLTEELIQK